MALQRHEAAAARREEKAMQRDEKRWELDLASSPDYEERQRSLGRRDRIARPSRGRREPRR
jgi:hypothetical protein